MRYLTITSVLTTALFAAISDAKAAGWSNDIPSCDIKVTNLSWFGKQGIFDVTLFL